MSVQKGVDELPVVDLAFLAQCLGFTEWPKERPLCNRYQRMAARVITDAHRPDPTTGKVYAAVALKNATSWMERAYDEGLRAGIEIERAEWGRKIRTIFGLDGRREGKF